jgi:sodium-dependent dicarboxylate transporter 2/3/5
MMDCMAEDVAARGTRRLGLWGGIAVAAIMLAAPPPTGLSAEGWAAAAVAVVMAIWWMTEALPIAVTALVPLVLFPLLGVASSELTARPYADPLIFLLLGGFMLARAIERWSLHERLAGALTRWSGDQPAAKVGALMVATAFLSMWVSNTASAMVMLPIGAAVATAMDDHLQGGSDRERTDTRAAMLLGVAYAATIGGMATLVGTPPNALFAAYMANVHGVSIGFADWLVVGFPTAAVLLVLTWVVLTKIAFRLPRVELLAGRRQSNEAILATQPLSRAQTRVLWIAGATALAWTLAPVIRHMWPMLAVSDAGFAIAATIALFVMSSGSSGARPLLVWDDVITIKWDVLLLVGGGLALAHGVGASGLARWIGESVGGLRHVPLPVLTVLAMIAVVYLGELASNTAIAAIFLPVAGAAAIGLGENPIAMTLPIAMATSLGFMLPVATPPNAIVYASGMVSSAQMLRAGAILDVASIAVVAILALSLGAWAFR